MGQMTSAQCKIDDILLIRSSLHYMVCKSDEFWLLDKVLLVRSCINGFVLRHEYVKYMPSAFSTSPFDI